jgi:hypothetical protein
MTSPLITRLRAAIDEDEKWAVAASTGWHGVTATGEHWQWACGECDTPVPVEPLYGSLRCPACGNSRADLRSKEQYATDSVGDLPHMPMGGGEEVEPTVAGHIVRHDPARVLAMVAAHREVLEQHRRYWPWGGPPPPATPSTAQCVQCWTDTTVTDLEGRPMPVRSPWPCRTLLALAKGYGIEVP